MKKAGADCELPEMAGQSGGPLRALAPAPVYTVPCPLCGVKAGEPCRSFKFGYALLIGHGVRTALDDRARAKAVK